MDTDNGNNANHRMYVLQGTSTLDPTKPFNVRDVCSARESLLIRLQLVGQITSPDNNWAIDGTVLKACSLPLFRSLAFHLRRPQYQNGQLYFIWSGWDSAASPNTQNLYIAHMSSPSHIDGARVLLHAPNPSWQQSQLNGNLMKINEGPEILVNAGRTFLVYCAFVLARSMVRVMAERLFSGRGELVGPVLPCLHGHRRRCRP
jgi:hypothetical protein